MSKGIRMTEESITEICEDTECFKTPNLNHQLLLHRRGFRKIENLDAYVNVKTLYLEGNSISKIENLHPMEHLRALFLQENCIGREMGLENLAQVSLLLVLNLENNGIKSLEGFPRMGSLETLLLRNNEIECITPIMRSLRITTIDLSYNAISDPAVLDQLGQMEDLKVLYMKNNPLIETTSFYRKRALAKVPYLTFLDDRPIFPNEKRLSEAWVRGGRKEEDREREVIQSEQDSGHSKHYVMDESEQFSEDDPEEMKAFRSNSVEHYTIAGPKPAGNQKSNDDENVAPVKKGTESTGNEEGAGKAMPEEKNATNPMKMGIQVAGKCEIEINKGRWTEILDQLLTMNASAYQYDFQQVSDHMKMVAVSESLDPGFFSQDECEKRWKVLDTNMRDETWGIPEAAEACTEELRIAEANRTNEQR